MYSRGPDFDGLACLQPKAPCVLERALDRAWALHQGPKVRIGQPCDLTLAAEQGGSGRAFGHRGNECPRGRCRQASAMRLMLLEAFMPSRVARRSATLSR